MACPRSSAGGGVASPAGPALRAEKSSAPSPGRGVHSPGPSRGRKKRGGARADARAPPENKFRRRATLPRATPAVPSPLRPFTAVFGMGTGVTFSPWPPEKASTDCCRKIQPRSSWGSATLPGGD